MHPEQGETPGPVLAMDDTLLLTMPYVAVRAQTPNPKINKLSTTYFDPHSNQLSLIFLNKLKLKLLFSLKVLVTWFYFQKIRFHTTPTSPTLCWGSHQVYRMWRCRRSLAAHVWITRRSIVIQFLRRVPLRWPLVAHGPSLFRCQSKFKFFWWFPPPSFSNPLTTPTSAFKTV